MKYRPLGKSGIEASVIGLGTWAMGGGPIWGDDSDDVESVHSIHAAMDLGINLIDTAPVYGFGRSEIVVGAALKGRRDKAVVATKCGLWWEDERGSEMGEFDGKELRRSLRPDTIREELEGSLRRLGTDYIDLYQTHWQAIEPEKTPIPETMECLARLKEEGKIRAIGVSNASLDELKEYESSGELSTNQPRYSILFRDIEKEVLPWCVGHNVATLAYMPLEQGLLTGKIGPGTEFKPGDWRSNSDWNPWYKPENRPRVIDLLRGWMGLIDKYGCTFSQLVIAWTLAQSGVTHALCGARRVHHARENARGGELELETGDIEKMKWDAVALGEPG